MNSVLIRHCSKHVKTARFHNIESPAFLPRLFESSAISTPQGVQRRSPIQFSPRSEPLVGRNSSTLKFSNFVQHLSNAFVQSSFVRWGLVLVFNEYINFRRLPCCLSVVGTPDTSWPQMAERLNLNTRGPAGSCSVRTETTVKTQATRAQSITSGCYSLCIVRSDRFVMCDGSRGALSLTY